MQNDLNIDVTTLDESHRQALEEIMGLQLTAGQQLVIHVIEPTGSNSSAARPAQTLEDWTGVYNGLSDSQIEAVDKVAKSRANLTRNLP